jgi:hypothetical protein
MSSGIRRRVVVWKSTDVSEEYVASTFMVEEKSEQETSVKAGGNQRDMFLRNVGRLSTDYTALYPRRQNSSELLTTIFFIFILKDPKIRRSFIFLGAVLKQKTRPIFGLIRYLLPFCSPHFLECLVSVTSPQRTSTYSAVDWKHTERPTSWREGLLASERGTGLPCFYILW